MKHLFFSYLLACLSMVVAAPAGGQTVRDVVASTNGSLVAPTNFFTQNLPAWATATNAAGARTNLGIPWGGLTNTNAGGLRSALGMAETNDVAFSRVQTGLSVMDNTGFTGNLILTAGQAISFSSGGVPGPTRTNLGLPWSGLTNTNAAGFRSALGVATTNDVTFNNGTFNGSFLSAPNATNLSDPSYVVTRASLMSELALAAMRWVSLGPVSYGQSGTGSAAVGEYGPTSSGTTTGTGTNGWGRTTLASWFGRPATLLGNGIDFGRPWVVVGNGFLWIGATNSVLRVLVGGNGSTPVTAEANAFTNRGLGIEFRRTATNSLAYAVLAHNGTNYTSTASTDLGITGVRSVGLAVSNSGTGTARVLISTNTETTGWHYTTTLTNAPTGLSASADRYLDITATSATNTASPENTYLRAATFQALFGTP